MFVDDLITVDPRVCSTIPRILEAVGRAFLVCTTIVKIYLLFEWLRHYLLFILQWFDLEIATARL